MINRSAGLEVRRVPLEQIVIGEQLERDPARVLRYAELLADRRRDMEPALLELVPGPGPDLELFRIRNGHHRFVAAIIAGRPDLLAVVVVD